MTIPNKKKYPGPTIKDKKKQENKIKKRNKEIRKIQKELKEQDKDKKRIQTIWESKLDVIFNHLENKNIFSTSKAIENYYRTTLPRFRK